MSDVAAPAQTATTNGTSAPQAPAPGVTTPTPTPKNGEGAVAPATPSPWADFDGQVEINYKGQKEKLALKSRDDLARLAQRAKLSDESSKRALAAEKQLQDILAVAGKDTLAYLKAAGVDPDAFVMQRAQEMLRQNELTAEQRQVETAKQEAARAKQEAAQLRAQFEAAQREKALEQAWAEDGPQWEAALKSRNRIGDKAYAEMAANIAQFLTEHGISATPEQICGEADEQWNKQALGYATASPARTLEAIAATVDPAAAMKALGPRLTPEHLWSALQTDDARRQLMALGLAWYKGLKTNGTNATKPTTPDRSRDTKGKYLTESEWKARRGG